MNSGGFLSIKNRREIYSFILDTLNLNEKYKIIPEKISQEKYEKDELTVKNDCLRSVFYKIIKEEEKLKKYKEEEKMKKKKMKLL